MEALIVIGFLIAGAIAINSYSKEAKRKHYAKYNIISAPEEKGIISDMVSDMGFEVGDPQWKTLRESRKISASLVEQNELLSKIANNNSDKIENELLERIRQLEATVNMLQKEKQVS